MSNHATITGNAGADCEIRYTPNGAAVANFNLGDTPRRFDRDRNEWVDAGDTLWLRVNVWRDLAEDAAEKVRRGSRVTVTGTLKQRNWQGKDGNKRVSVEIDAESVAVHPPRNKGQGQPSGYGAQRAPQPDPWTTPAPQQQAPQGQAWGTAPNLDEPPF